MQIAAVRETLRHDPAEFTICTELCLAAHWLMPCLSRFQVDHPNLRLRILTSPEPLQDARSEADLIFTYGGLTNCKLQPTRQFEEQIVPLCSPHFRKILPESCTAADVAAATLVDFGDDDGSIGGGSWPRMTLALCRELD